MSRNPSEIGSEFHYIPLVSHDNISWFDSSVFLAHGRGVISLLQNIINDQILYYPDYFCKDVISYWNIRGINTSPYRVYYFESKIKVDFSTVPKSGVILAVNFFGANSGKQWKNYKKNNDIILIEDHSHSPVSNWAKSSNADYAFSSLRKTLPIPDGCVFWSPQKKQVTVNVIQKFDSYKKLEAMYLKNDYLIGKHVNKSTFLSLYSQGELELANSEVALISDFSFNILKHGYPEDYTKIRINNLRCFLGNLSTKTFDYVEAFKFSDSDIPLGAILKCRSKKIRNSLCHYLILNDVYCAVHWPLSSIGVAYDESLALSAQIITVPIDQRYSLQDIVGVAQLVNKFFDDE